jgi:hypothetical protein
MEAVQETVIRNYMHMCLIRKLMVGQCSIQPIPEYIKSTQKRMIKYDPEKWNGY